MIAVIILGIATMLFSYASTASVDIETENGVLSGGAGLVNDSSASKGVAVKFGQPYQDLFVSTTGSDSKDGKSQANAVKTINKAVQLANGYTRIRLMAGRYLQTVQIQKNNLIIEPFGNGDVDIVGALPEFVNESVTGNIFNMAYTNRIWEGLTMSLADQTLFIMEMATNGGRITR